MSLKSQEFTASGTFNVPAGVSCVLLTMIGGGAGGSNTPYVDPGDGHGGGGAGEMCVRRPYPVTPGAAIAVTIGAGGAGGVVQNDPDGTNGGDTSFGTALVRGGQTPLAASIGRRGGPGGGTRGGESLWAGAVLSAPETPNVACGGAGGSGGQGTLFQFAEAGADWTSVVGGDFGPGGTTLEGGGGAASPWGTGGQGGKRVVGGSPLSDGSPAPAGAYGAGGGGAGATNTGGTGANGGDGMSGYCLVEWSA